MNSRPSGLAHVRRAAAMPLPEVFTRSRQLAWKLAGRFGLRSVNGRHMGPITTRPLMPALCDLHRTAEAVHRVDAEGAHRIIEQADAACEGRFPILGFGMLDFGEPVDWHLDPVYGRRSPNVHFSRIDPLDVHVVGDHKIVWELNRHGFLQTLAQGYALTGDHRYVARATHLLREWLECNPPEVGVNWVSSLEVAFRAITWAYVWPLFGRSPHLAQELRNQWLASITLHARHVARFTSHYFAPNTHLTGEGLALYLIGLTFPELRRARRYRRLGRRILDTEFARQLRADGFHYEQSACYHRYTFEFLLLDYLATALLTFESAAAARERLERAADAALPLLQPDGELVNVGDEDGGQLLSLGVRDPLDARPLLAACALILRRPDLKAIVGRLPAEVLWLLGPEAEHQWETLPDVAPPKASRVLPSSGYVAMRDTWGESASHLLFDAGPHGAARCRYGHAHADALSMTLSIGGAPFLVDPGTGSYVDRPRRESLRGTFSHSTAWVDDEAHCIPGKTFDWLTAANGTLRRWRSTTEFDLAEGVHDGYRDATSPVMHRRRVLHWKQKGWLVWDLFEGDGERRISVQFVLAAEPGTVVLRDSTVITPTGVLSVLPVKGAPILESSLRPIEVSPRYGAFAIGSAFRAVVKARLPTAITTLICPPGPPPSLRPLSGWSDSHEGARGTECAFHDEGTGDHLLVRDFDAGPPFGGERLRSDAAITWVSGSSGEILVVGGSSVVVDDRKVLESRRVGDWLIATDVTHSLDPMEQFSA
ncbi:MAG: heparinase II/III family protein [Myxococcales bacterium]|nr:heparinase II/III family protein [Myxococcales bacterium]